MAQFTSALYQEAEMPDVVTQIGSRTYIGKFDRNRYDKILPAEEQPIWQIRCVETSNIAMLNMLEDEDNPSTGQQIGVGSLGSTTYKTLYPDGSKLYRYTWNDKEQYDYNYLR